jgi:predicted Zn-dependent peptidase
MSIGKSHLAYEHIDSLKEINAKIEAITAMQLIDTANEILDPKNLSTLIFHA